MADKKVTIVLSPLLADVMQRMIAEESFKQKVWSFDDHAPTRKIINEELDTLSVDLAKQGYPRFFKV